MPYKKSSDYQFKDIDKFTSDATCITLQRMAPALDITKYTYSVISACKSFFFVTIHDDLTKYSKDVHSAIAELVSCIGTEMTKRDDISSEMTSTVMSIVQKALISRDDLISVSLFDMSNLEETNSVPFSVFYRCDKNEYSVSKNSIDNFSEFMKEYTKEPENT